MSAGRNRTCLPLVTTEDGLLTCRRNPDRPSTAVPGTVLPSPHRLV